jgi:hypothetical protein
MVSTLLASVDVVRAKDAQGQEIVPAVDVTGGSLSHAVPFHWAVRSRGLRAEALVAASLAC